jgi:type I restriction enzyme S subunit
MKKGWVTKTVGEICDIERGGSPRPIQSFITTASNGINWIKIGDATASGKYICETEQKIKPEGAKRSRMVYEGDFILSNSMSFGRPYIMKTSGCIHDGWLVLRQPKIDPDYLYYVLGSDLVFNQFDQLAAGSTVRNLNIGLAKTVKIPIPPLAEQQRIVGLLDEAFEGLATAKATAEKNLQNAHALFESHLQSVFTQRGEGWVQRRLGDLVTRLTNGYVGPTRNIYYDTGVPYLLARHVKDNRLKFDGKTFITDEFNRKNKKSILKAGDVLLVQSGHIGHSAVVTEEHVGHNCHAMIVITAVEGAFIGPFLSLFFNSSGMKQKFQEIRSGSTVPHLTCGEVKELMIPLPDLATQRRVVAHSQELNEETRSLARLYERKLAALEELKKSLLHQAFSGEL